MLILSIIILLFIFQLYLAFRKPGVALALLPLSILVYFIFGDALDGAIDTEVLSLSLSIIVIPAVLLITALQKVSIEKENPISKTIAKFILMVLGSIILSIPLLYVWPVAIILIPVFIAINVQCNKVARYNTTLYVVSTIGSSMRQNLPLPMALVSAASNVRNKRNMILCRISSWMTKGYPVSEAIRLGYSKCPTDILAMITAAEKINQLPETIGSIEQDLLTKSEQKAQPERFSMTYLVTVLSAIICISLGLIIFIIPTFAEVLQDMSEGTVPLPSATQTLMDLSNWLLGRNGLNALLLLSPIILMAICSAFGRALKLWTGKMFTSTLSDFFKWYFPVTNWFERNHALAQFSSIVRSSLSAGLPVDQAIENSLTLEMNYFFKRRLTKWHYNIQRGLNISDSARELRISDSIAWAFDDRVNKGNTPQILQMLEEFYRSIYTYRINIAKSIAMPLSIVALGSIVGFVIYAMFVPMIAILTFLTDTALP